MWFSDDGGAEHRGEAEEPAEAGEDPAVEPSVHRRQRPAGTAADAGRITQLRSDLFRNIMYRVTNLQLQTIKEQNVKLRIRTNTDNTID